jgi:hypothetical protein
MLESPISLLSPTLSSAAVKNEAQLSWKESVLFRIQGSATDPDRFAAREVSMKPKNSILANVMVLALIGILAGAIAGFGVGAITGRSASSTTTTSQ